MPEVNRIVELKVHAMRFLKEIDDEIRLKLSEIEKLKQEVAGLETEKEAIQKVIRDMEGVGGTPRKQETQQQETHTTVQAEPAVKATQTQTPVTQTPAAGTDSRRVQSVAPEAASAQPTQTVIQRQPVAYVEKPSNTSANPPGVQPASAPHPDLGEPSASKKAVNGEKRWEPISVNSTEYARYSLGKSTIDLEFKFAVPVDSKYVKGFILDKYLQKLKEDGMMRVKRGEIAPENCFSFDVKTTENGEITAIHIGNVASEQTQDLLNKIKWFVASEVRELKAKGKIA
ncbi:MAG: hypothetical protein QW767_06290 [Thermoprotei archaeon]